MVTTDNRLHMSTTPAKPVRSLTCSRCGGAVAWQSGERVAVCPFCGLTSQVHGEQALRRWQVLNQVPRSEAKKALARYLKNVQITPGWQRAIRLRDFFLIPLWVARYEYQERIYPVVLDGLSSVPVHGKAPGNVYVRAGALVGAMLAGTNLFLFSALMLSNSWLTDRSKLLSSLLGFVFMALLAFGFIRAGYRLFCYGGEVATMDPRDALAEGKAYIGGKYAA